MKHIWIKCDTRPDIFAAENLGNEYHNGPKCERCGFEFCQHCNPKGWKTNCGSKPLKGDDSKLDNTMIAVVDLLRRRMGGNDVKK